MKIRKSLAALAAAAALLLAAPAPAHATGTWVWSRPIPHTVQDADWNCVPAAFTDQLTSAFPNGTWNQDTLAAQFKTMTGGTDWSNAEPALNQMVGPQYLYDIRYVASSSELLTEVQYSIDKYSAAVVVGVVEGKLPYINDPTNLKHHAITVYGYNVAQNAVYAWDPFPGRGYEWLRVTDLYNSLEDFHGVYELERAW